MSGRSKDDYDAENKPNYKNIHIKTTDLEIKTTQHHSDGSIKQIKYALFIPGIKELKNSQPVYSYNHAFRIDLPREYPARVDKIKIYVETQIFHPRFHSSGWGEACLHINGEIDRILMDMIFQVLCDPDRIRPPKMYSDSDFGTNSSAMKWFQNNNPVQIYQSLMEEWGRYRNKKLKSKMSVLESSSSKSEPKIL